jgi:CubicO group peptidase (beta-lactamase class C family)
LSGGRRSIGLVTVFGDVCAAIQEQMAETATPGVAVAILQEGEEHAAGFGVTSTENPLEVTPDTLFQIGSITKTFTGTVAMVLVERGELDLDAPLRTYLPELELADATVAERVTTRHLLTHTGGWEGDYFDDFGAGDDALARMIDALVSVPQLTPLGEIWSYNNAGFYLAGRVIEVVAQTTYEQAVQELLLDPLEMKNTFFFPEDVMTRRFAVGHHRSDEGPPPVARPWPIGRAHHAAGALASSVRELVRWGRFHMSDGGGVLARATLDEMQRSQLHVGSIFDEIGITWAIANRNGRRVLSHGGGTSGQIAFFGFLPDEGSVLTVLTNHQRGAEVVKAATETFGIGDPERVAIDLDPSEYIGTYTSALVDVELRREDGSLLLVYTPKGGFPRKDSPPAPGPPPAPAAFYAEDRLFVPEGPLKGTEAEFLRDPDGRIAWFRFGGRTMAPR